VAPFAQYVPLPQFVPPGGRHKGLSTTQEPDAQTVPSVQQAPPLGAQVLPQQVSVPLQMVSPQQVCLGPRQAAALAQQAPPTMSQHSPAQSGVLQPPPVLPLPVPHAQLKICDVSSPQQSVWAETTRFEWPAAEKVTLEVLGMQGHRVTDTLLPPQEMP
jgi:hypothetical protein